ncbi:hypothetical protein RchiOBHm_Chr2g0160641 [Rosa chinensis]|uniref:Transmembrane protein n=1 Tax=Rosa chinensis TaxID=74649 RepID=A0A2P6S2K9_ROSCH|nr:uncharacterized protein LOC112188447 [Rosa chinensis]PRQ52907.1 hypothetical protein RchiOBHm_Chr2g0160641 [Rosa chinensis]
MARVGLVCLVLLAGILVVQAMAEKSELNPTEAKPQNGVLAAHSDSDSGSDQSSVSVAEEPSHSMEESQVAEGPSIRRLGSSKHHQDKSVAGGGVIIGGLVTAIFAAVFCYIRVTRKRGGVY